MAGTPPSYVCGPMLEGARNLLVELLDPVTGLPYDHLRCGCNWEGPIVGGAAGVLV